MKTIIFLEWVRGFAAAIVVVTHVAVIHSPQFDHFTRNYLDLGRVGVVAFFLVSGYVISLSLRRQDLRTFMLRRILRLYPIYIATLTIYLLIAYPDAEWSSGAWWAEVFANYTMFQELVGFAALLGPAWTLSIEWVFYIQQMSVKACRLLDQAWKLGYVWLGGYLLANIAERVLGLDLPVTLPMLLAAACLGQALYLAHIGVIKHRPFWVLAVANVVVVPAGAYIGLQDALWPPLTYSTSYVAGIGLFAVAFMFRHRDGGGVLIWLGSTSYAMYLIHPVVMELSEIWSGGSAWVSIALSAILIPALSWMAYLYIEKPSKNLGRAMTPSRPKPLPADAAIERI